VVNHDYTRASVESDPKDDIMVSCLQSSEDTTDHIPVEGATISTISNQFGWNRLSNFFNRGNSNSASQTGYTLFGQDFSIA